MNIIINFRKPIHIVQKHRWVTVCGISVVPDRNKTVRKTEHRPSCKKCLKFK